MTFLNLLTYFALVLSISGIAQCSYIKGKCDGIEEAIKFVKEVHENVIND